MRAVASALRVLSAFGGRQASWGVSELSEALALTKSHVVKVLADLRDAGYVQQDPATRIYSVGIRAFALGAQYLNNDALAREASGPMRRLTDRTGHTTTLCRLHGADIIHLASVEGSHFLDVGWRVGTWVPFHATAVGKVLFAFAERDLLDRAVKRHGMPRLSERTVCDLEVLRRQLAHVRRLGWSETSEETMKGLAAQAVPIYDATQNVIAALGFIYPYHSVDRRQRKSYAAALHDAARTVSVRLGAQVYPYGGKRRA